MFLAGREQGATLDGQVNTTIKQDDNHSQGGFNRIVSFGYSDNDHYKLPKIRSSKNISILGLGHMGTVSAIGLAALGHNVIGVDHDQRKVNELNQWRTYPTESGLQQLLNRVAKFNNLFATDDAFNAIRHTDITLVCIGNSIDNNGEHDTESLITLCEQLGTIIRDKPRFHLFVWCYSSTRKISSQAMITKIEHAAQKVAGKDFGFCAIHRTLRKQHAIEDFYHPAQITLSSYDKNSATLAAQIFNDFDTKIRHNKLV